MDLESRLELVKGVGEEVITEAELRALLETNEHPTAYDGFEPSGLAHFQFGEVPFPIQICSSLRRTCL
ncbi:MAG: hypothetical protein JRM79_04375 [Nitrososphaerota archaeon]|jgi:tyrosyl-tRNA synthetase|nr:hypothetical protein [Nitrososphaerota archaeon]MDG6945490.1 hypothetical protein [Nitrososphaerota archaeon]MDG6952042.1 hypothetical protein [Nitrososphaerota archaeon]MDG6958863.1 hypothetical protein [Nitrososphaerota archaeon]MDG6961302.1 hypothetical protein [Nitrososphaerota archaeon]